MGDPGEPARAERMRPYAPFRHAGALVLKRRPLHLTFFVTRRCNARCGFCFSRDRAGTAGPELSLGEAERVAGSLGDLLWLSFSGGEVFLREDLPAVAEVFARRTRPVIILLSTNGLLPERAAEATGEILARCPRSTVAVKLSLDGPPDLHDRLRGVPGAFDLVQQTHRRLAALARREPRLELGVNTVLCAANQSRMGETSALVRGMAGVRTHTVSLVRGTLPDPALGDVDLERYREASEAIAHGLRAGTEPVYRFRGARLKAAQDVLQRRLILETARQRAQVIPCHAGRLNLVLAEDGRLFPCEDFSLEMGNVRDHGYDVPRTAASERGRAVLADIRRGACWCTHECYMMTNIFFSLRCWPALLAECLRLPPAARRRG